MKKLLISLIFIWLACLACSSNLKNDEVKYIWNDSLSQSLVDAYIDSLAPDVGNFTWERNLNKSFMFNYRKNEFEEVNLDEMKNWKQEDWEQYLPQIVPLINIFRLYLTMGFTYEEAYIKALSDYLDTSIDGDKFKNIKDVEMEQLLKS